MRLIVTIPEALFKMRVDACQFAHQDMIKYPFGLAISKGAVCIYIYIQIIVNENATFKKTVKPLIK